VPGERCSNAHLSSVYCRCYRVLYGTDYFSLAKLLSYLLAYLLIRLAVAQFESDLLSNRRSYRFWSISRLVYLVGITSDDDVIRLRSISYLLFFSTTDMRCMRLLISSMSKS